MLTTQKPNQLLVSDKALTIESDIKLKPDEWVTSADKALGNGAFTRQSVCLFVINAWLLFATLGRCSSLNCWNYEMCKYELMKAVFGPCHWLRVFVGENSEVDF